MAMVVLFWLVINLRCIVHFMRISEVGVSDVQRLIHVVMMAMMLIVVLVVMFVVMSLEVVLMVVMLITVVTLMVVLVGDLNHIIKNLLVFVVGSPVRRMNSPQACMGLGEGKSLLLQLPCFAFLELNLGS